MEKFSAFRVICDSNNGDKKYWEAIMLTSDGVISEGFAFLDGARNPQFVYGIKLPGGVRNYTVFPAEGSAIFMDLYVSNVQCTQWLVDANTYTSYGEKKVEFEEKSYEEIPNSEQTIKLIKKCRNNVSKKREKDDNLVIPQIYYILLAGTFKTLDALFSYQRKVLACGGEVVINSHQK